MPSRGRRENSEQQEKRSRPRVGMLRMLAQARGVKASTPQKTCLPAADWLFAMAPSL